MSVRVLLPTGFGINCEAETAHAFGLAGAQVDALHLSDLLQTPARLAGCNILALAGGFSFGDHLGAGLALASRLRRLKEDFGRFLADGGVILGICNGFQVLVRMGLLPQNKLGRQQVSLAANQRGTFYDGWVTLRVDPKSPCIFTRGLDRIELPVRHGEGRVVIPAALEPSISQDHLAVLRYIDPQSGQPTTTFPQNPNGSRGGVAGLCDKSGRIFGLMPHPEAFLYPENHPHWRRRKTARHGAGLALFENAVTHCRGG